jgi:hypothetical protein
MLTGVLEFSPSPTSDVDGFFTDPGTIAYAYDDTSTTFDSAPFQFPPGTWYVHVSAYDPATCDPVTGFCTEEFSSPPVTLVVPPDPPPPPLPPPPPTPPAPPPAPAPPAAAAQPDTVTAFASLSVRASQKVDKLLIEAVMAEAGTIAAAGTVNVPNLSKVYKFKTASATAAPGVKVPLRPKLPAKAVKAVKKALKKRKKLKAKITITATDNAGNKKVERRTIKLKR